MVRTSLRMTSRTLMRIFVGKRRARGEGLDECIRILRCHHHDATGQLHHHESLRVGPEQSVAAEGFVPINAGEGEESAISKNADRAFQAVWIMPDARESIDVDRRRPKQALDEQAVTLENITSDDEKQ